MAMDFYCRWISVRPATTINGGHMRSVMLEMAPLVQHMCRKSSGQGFRFKMSVQPLA